ncbi:MAG: quinolinate synthase NadA [Methanosarcinales archaeon]|nr:MAG: quinolinate synthase NadA [Methanosarcinales archaeon]
MHNTTNNEQTEQIERIERLKQEKNAIVLAHNYERAEVRAVADVVGGSSGLTRAANNTSADMIIVCGVDFMAEMASVLNSDKKVITPVQNVICPLARRLSRNDLNMAKKENPGAEVLLYMNSLADTIAMADCVCTAANAIPIAGAMGGDSPIIFGPDYGVTYYLRKRTEKEIITLSANGFCPVHHTILPADMIHAQELHPAAQVVAHPECRPEVQDRADYIGSTSGIARFCKESAETEFLVAADVGLSTMLRNEAPDKTFYPISEATICERMKAPTLAKVEEALVTERFQVTVPKEIADAARIPIERMLELS